MNNTGPAPEIGHYAFGKQNGHLRMNDIVLHSEVLFHPHLGLLLGSTLIQAVWVASCLTALMNLRDAGAGVKDIL